VYHCGSEVFKTQGIKGFYRGFYMISIRAFPVNAITFLTYELLHQKCKTIGNSSSEPKKWCLMSLYHTICWESNTKY